MNNPLLTEFESRVLSLIAAANGDQVGEDAVLHACFPPPEYPKGALVGSPESRAWLVTQRAWQDRAFSGNGVEYADCYARASSLALIRLINLKLIREFNNGFNCGSYAINKSVPDWRAAFVS